MNIINGEAIGQRWAETDARKAEGKDTEAAEGILHVAWIIRQMDITGNYNIEDYLYELEKRGGDAAKLEKLTGWQVLRMCERWAEAFRAFLASAEDAGEANP